MVETMARIEDMVGVDETSKPRRCDGVTISEVHAELVLLAEKDVEGAAVELGPFMDKGGAAIPKVGLLGSKNRKEWYDGSTHPKEGSVEGVCKKARGKLAEKCLVRCPSNESILSSAERGSILRCFLGESVSLASGSMVKVDGLKRCKGVRLCDDSPELTLGPSPRSRRDLHRGRRSATVNF